MWKLAVILLTLICCGCGDRKDSDYYLRSAIEYPIHSVEIVIPFGGGGASDFFVRNFSTYLKNYYPDGIIFSNIPGKGGLYAARAASRKPADGYTILEITPSVIISDILYDTEHNMLMDNFIPVARIQVDNYVLSVNPRSEFNSFTEFIDSNKGKTVYVSGLSSGGLDSILTKLLSEKTGVTFKLIPYKSGAEAKVGIVSGETQLYIDKVISVSELIKKGLVKPLLVITDQDKPVDGLLKNISTSKEIGLNIPISSWRGFMLRKEVPSDISRYISSSMKSAAESQKYTTSFPLVRTDFMEAEEFGNYIKNQYKLFSNIINGAD